ncbi:MAG: CBS domain-containing protein [Desulfobacteraceae bacterium]|nr:CBS domain-containing protein [Desulfobacteraceae bacterium]MBC2719067.1 CBS domain-containing protein [Desulfobacteraceae bacterium]
MKKVKDFITRDLTSVTEDTPLREVAELLSLRELIGIPVVNRENEVTGWISETDIITSIFPERVKIENPDVIYFMNLSHVVKKLSQVGQAMVSDYMIRNVYHVKEDTPASDVVELMLHKDFKRVPVVRNKRLVGVVDRSSLSRILLEEGSID